MVYQVQLQVQVYQDLVVAELEFKLVVLQELEQQEALVVAAMLHHLMAMA